MINNSKKDGLFGDMPSEVAQVIARKICAFGGRVFVDVEEYKRIQQTIEKYPEWFPVETAYNKVPREIHDQYKKEVAEARKRIIPLKSGEIESIDGEGIFGYLKRLHEHQIKLAEKIAGEPFDVQEFAKQWEADRKNESDFLDAKKKLWKKYYSAFKIPFQD